MSVKGFKLSNGTVEKYDYSALENIVTDATLALSGVAADAKAVGDELTDVKADLQDLQEEIEGGGSGMSTAFKQALHNILEKVAYIDDDGQIYLDALDDAMFPPVTAISLNTNSLSFATLNNTQQLIATTTPTGGNVTWSSSDTSIATVSATGLVTSVGYGSATITATSGSVSATCSVVVAQATLVSISATYTQSGTVYNTDSLDTLKDDLVVTATWSNSTTTTVPSTDYTLSGTLTVGTSTITVSYGGKTTTFNVTVTKAPSSYVTDGLIARFDGIDNTGNGHDSTATTWKDLVGTYDIATPANSGGTWASDGLVLDGTQGRVFVASTIWTLPEESTIEIVLNQCNVVSPYTSGVVAGFTADVRFCFCPNNMVGFEQPINYYNTGVASFTDIYHMTALYTGKVVSSAYINGIQAELSGATGSLKHGNNKLILGVQDNSAAGYQIAGKIMAIRVYNRQLTASELQQNLETDAERFGTGGVS